MDGVSAQLECLSLGLAGAEQTGHASSTDDGRQVLKKSKSMAGLSASSSISRASRRSVVQADDATARDPFALLSTEVSLHILSFLRKTNLVHVAQVSRWWKTLAYDPSLWRTLDFSKLDLCDDALADSFATRLGGAKHLCFSGCAGITDRSAPLIAERCNILEELKLSDCTITDDTLFVLAQHAAKDMVATRPSGLADDNDIDNDNDNDNDNDDGDAVQAPRSDQQSCDDDAVLPEFPRHSSVGSSDSDATSSSPPGGRRMSTRPRQADRLRELALVRTDITDDGIKALAQRFTQLISLSVSGTLVSSIGLEVLAQSCSGLRHLYLSGCKRIDNNALRFIASGCTQLSKLNLQETLVDDEGVAALAAGCTELEELSLAECDISDDAISALALSCAGLQRLYLSGCTDITDNALRALSTGCPNLLKLVLFKCRRVTDDGCVALAAGCHALQELNLCRCRITDVALEHLALGCPSLQYLRLGKCSAIGDAGVGHIAHHLRNASTLDFKNCGLTDVGLSEVAQYCTNLNSLMLSRTKVSDASMEAVSQLSQLSRLVLRHCRAVTDITLACLSRNASGLLSDLDISGCDVTSDGVEAMLANPSLAWGLQRLNLAQTVVSDHVLGIIAVQCRNLSSLMLNACPAVSPIGLQYLATGCDALVDLDLTSCPGVTQASIEQLRKRRIKVTYKPPPPPPPPQEGEQQQQPQQQPAAAAVTVLNDEEVVEQ